MNFEELSRFKSDNQASISPGSQKEEKPPHITSRGREGRALRKKLAMSLGLIVGSSAGSSASTTSHSEEEHEPTQNVLEMFRKQVKMTASQRRQIPKLNSEEQQVSNNGESSMSIRKTVHRRTRTTTRELLDDGDDMDETDYQERSRDQTRRLEHERHEIINRKQNDTSTSQQQTKKTKKTVSQQDINAAADELNDKSQLANFTDTGTNVTPEHTANSITPSEDIFSSFGVQNDFQTHINQGSNHDRSSVKLLREKIRSNARARKLPRPGGVSYRYHEKEERGSKDQSLSSGKDFEDRTSISASKQTERKISGSQIPVRIGKKSEEEKSLVTKDDTEGNEIEIREMGNKSVLQKSKIPRRKSQNSADRKDIRKTSDSGIESLTSEVFSSNNDFTRHEKERPKERLEIDIDEEGRREVTGDSEISVKLTQELHSGFNSDLLFDEAPTSSGSTSAQIEAKSNNKAITNKTMKNKLTNILTTQKSLDVFRKSFSTKKNQSKPKDRASSFDSLEAELARLKSSVFKTYDDFQEMKDLTLSLSKELKEIRNI